MAKLSSQKFIGRNRAPRVQIEYDVETYGANKTVSLPFVTGVMSGLSGDNTADLPPVPARSFVEFDADNFDERMKAIHPTVVTTVANTLSGEGRLPVELAFNSINDFAPDAIARQVEPLRQLLEARQQLNNLLRYMDGKEKAEALIARLMTDPALLETLSRQAAVPVVPAADATESADTVTPASQGDEHE